LYTSNVRGTFTPLGIELPPLVDGDERAFLIDDREPIYATSKPFTAILG
jgi:hypothetical protein